MKESLTLQLELPISAEVVYNAWLSSEEHSNMTGGPATCENHVGGKHTAWDGYIRGENLELVPNEKIVQSWRTPEFEENDEDSILEITFESTGSGGCKITLQHTNIPEGQTQYEQGWLDHYLEPMKNYFK